MSGGGSKAAAVQIPAPSRKLVQSLKEIVNCPEAEIYATLKDCDMDPDEAVNKLLSQDSFHEVKSKRDKKKEVKETVEPRPRAANNTSNRGPRVSSDRGSRSSSYQSSSNDNLGSRAKAGNYKENETVSVPTSSILGPASVPSSNYSQKPVFPSSGLVANPIQPANPSDSPSVPLQPSHGFQHGWSGGLHGHLSMADIVRMGRPQSKPQPPVTQIMDRSYSAQYPAMPNPNPRPVTHVPVQLADTDPAPVLVAPVTDNTGDVNTESVSDDWTLVDQPPAAETSGVISSFEAEGDAGQWKVLESGSEGQVQAEHAGKDSELQDELSESANAFHHEMEKAEEELQQLSVQEEEPAGAQITEENPAVIIPNHLQVSNADCAHLSFGSFGSGAFSGIFPQKNVNQEVDPDVTEDSSPVDQPDSRNEEYYNNGPLNTTPSESTSTARVSGTGMESLDMPSVSVVQTDVLRADTPDAGQHVLPPYNVPSVSSHTFAGPTQPNAPEYGYPQGNSTQLQNLSAFSSLLQANTLNSNLLAPTVPGRDFDISFSPLVTSTQSMPTKYMPAVPSTSGSSISMQEATKPGVYSNPQPTAPVQTQAQTLASTSIPTGPPLPQHLAVHPYSQPTLPLGPFTNLIGYPFLPQSYTYVPSTAFQQPYSSNGPFHQSGAATAVPNTGIKYTTLPQYKGNVSSASLAQAQAQAQQASSLVSGYGGGFGGSGSVPGSFPMNQGGSGSGSTSLGFDEALSSQYKDMSHYMSLQQSENPAMWLHGAAAAAGSRTLSTMPTSTFYSYQGQTQHGSFRQGQQPSQLNSLGYPNFYHSQIPGGAQEHHNPTEAAMNGSQATAQQPSHQLWQNTY